MVSRSVPYPNMLRACIKQAGYSFREISRETSIPESTLYDWAAGNRPIPHHERRIIARLLGCDEYNLQPQQSDDMLQFTQNEDLPSLGKEMNHKRRELLQLFGLAGRALLLPLPNVDWDHLGAAFTHSSTLDPTMVESLEAINTHCWNMFTSAQTKSSVLDGALGQLKMYVQFLKEPQTAQTRQKLCTLTSSMSQLVGEIYFDLHDYGTARSSYSFAAYTAKEAKAHDLWASALVRRAYVPLFEEHYQEALPFLQQAEQIVQQGDSQLSTKYWIAATSAEAEAGNGNLTACQRALEQAQGINMPTGTYPGWSRFEASRLPALQGACYVRLKQPQLAQSSLLEALQILPQHAQSGRRPGLIYNDLAMVAFQEKNVEQTCFYANKIIDLAMYNTSGFLRDNVQKLCNQLEPFKNTKAVQDLNKRTTSLIQVK